MRLDAPLRRSRYINQAVFHQSVFQVIQKLTCRVRGLVGHQQTSALSTSASYERIVSSWWESVTLQWSPVMVHTRSLGATQLSEKTGSASDRTIRKTTYPNCTGLDLLDRRWVTRRHLLWVWRRTRSRRRMWNRRRFIVKLTSPKTWQVSISLTRSDLDALQTSESDSQTTYNGQCSTDNKWPTTNNCQRTADNAQLTSIISHRTTDNEQLHSTDRLSLRQWTTNDKPKEGTNDRDEPNSNSN